ncbi:Uncharacterised protein [Salmonella enterica subsp. enterica serovar Typhi]|nr:Uncharacterised protein [Salmonella enterica subsp. enterica serovar Typhi]CGX17985.1 Uncharacterised protein [Salmonella enterica subsp. enterica serovar Typhi]CGX69065.1 Uncharacterised protein [Salmonella enterica subsp. enterica serovar Typhi]CGZ08265.1 Uncharacterised protein [Salmonella enterica subsp. enterica serovar Typhi]CGZ89801.1 Uncharacterised protein [Salmonella enterica subsp. enterica serovar Typhi]
MLRFHFNIFGVVHLFKRQLANPIRQGGGEQHVQTLRSRRHTTEQPADIFNKAQIVHAIGFIEYDDLNGAEVNVVLFGVVDQSARRTNKNINAAFQHFKLLVVTIAAVSQA